MELLTFAIAAGETKVFTKQGRYLEIIAASAPLDILLLGNSGESMDEMRGALSGLYAEGAFGQLQVKNTGASSQTVTLMITDGRGGSRRQPGVVSVVDIGQIRTDERRTFIGGQRQPGVASRNASIALQIAIGQQPVYVKSMTISAGAATFVDIGRPGSFGALNIDTTAGSPLQAKDGFFPSPSRGDTWAFTHTAMPTFINTYGSVLLPAFTPIQITFHDPIKVSADGSYPSLVAVATTQNVTLAGFFDMYGA